MKNMKKFKTIAFAIACLIISPLILSACSNSSDKVTITSVTVNNLASYYRLTDTIDFDAVTLTVNYSDNSTKELTQGEYDVDNALLSTTEFILHTDGLYAASLQEPMTEEGSYKITCTLISDGKTYDLTTVVVAYSLTSYYDVVSFDAPDLLTSYDTNKTRVSSTDEDSFYSTANYYVGDDNEFKFAPTLFAISKSDSEYLYLTNFNVNVTVTHGGHELDLSDNIYVSYSSSNYSFDFTEQAIGESFTITMSLVDFETDYFGNPIDAYSMTVTIADGWNVYDALDLGRMNLVSEDFVAGDYHRGNSQSIFWYQDENGDSKFKSIKTSDLWKNFLTSELGLEDDSTLTSINGIFLHGNITITSDDIPSEFFVSVEEAEAMGCNYDDMVGSVRDFSLLYLHFMENSDFTFNGNLFTLDFSQLKWGMTFWKGSSLTYYAENATSKSLERSTAISFSGNRYGTQYSVSFCNVNTIGNTAGVMSNSDADGINASGSLIFLKSIHTNTVVTNCIVKNYQIGLYAEISDDSYTCLDISKTKIYNSYNSGLFAWLSEKNTISNSEIKRTGGSAVFLVSGASSSTTDNDGATYYLTSGFTVSANTVVESYVSGNEAWFTLNNAESIVTTFKVLDGMFNYYGKTFLNSDEKLNLISIMLDSAYLSPSSNVTKFYFDFVYGSGTALNVDGAVETLGNEYTAEEYYAYMINYITSNYKAPVFMTDTGVLFYYNSTSFIDLKTNAVLASDSLDGATKVYILYPITGLTGYSTMIGVAVTLSDYPSSTTTE